MNRINLTLASFILLSCLGGCNSAFPEKSATSSTHKTSEQDKTCQDVVQMPVHQSTPLPKKTYKIIGE